MSGEKKFCLSYVSNAENISGLFISVLFHFEDSIWQTHLGIVN